MVLKLLGVFFVEVFLHFILLSVIITKVNKLIERKKQKHKGQENISKQMSESDKQSITCTAQLQEHIKGEILPPLKSMAVLSLTATEPVFHSRNIACNKTGETHVENNASLHRDIFSEEINTVIISTKMQLQNILDRSLCNS